ncbi:MAG: hypothetical protein ACPGQL_02665 [Thermoplasmatota archaeon]
MAEAPHGSLSGPLDAARHFGAFGGFIGLCCGLLYGVGGVFADLATTGLNVGTALALNAVWAMPLLGAAVGLVGGFLWWPLYRRLPERFGGGGRSGSHGDERL